MLGTEDKSLIKELGRRRVFLFVSLFLLIATPAIIFEESDQILHAVDDYVLFGTAVVGLVVLAASWKKDSLQHLRWQNNILTLLLFIALVFKIYGIMQEAADPTDFGDEIPLAILLVLSILNRLA